MKLVFHCCLVIKNSGGLQEDTTYLGLACLTMRANTERPVTVLEGTNQLFTVENLEDKVKKFYPVNAQSIPCRTSATAKRPGEWLRLSSASSGLRTLRCGRMNLFSIGCVFNRQAMGLIRHLYASPRKSILSM